MFSKVGQKKENKKIYISKEALKYLRWSAIMGRLLLLYREALTKMQLTFGLWVFLTKLLRLKVDERILKSLNASKLFS